MKNSVIFLFLFFYSSFFYSQIHISGDVYMYGAENLKISVTDQSGIYDNSNISKDSGKENLKPVVANDKKKRKNRKAVEKTSEKKFVENKQKSLPVNDFTYHTLPDSGKSFGVSKKQLFAPAPTSVFKLKFLHSLQRYQIQDFSYKSQNISYNIVSDIIFGTERDSFSVRPPPFHVI